MSLHLLLDHFTGLPIPNRVAVLGAGLGVILYLPFIATAAGASYVIARHVDKPVVAYFSSVILFAPAFIINSAYIYVMLIHHAA